MPKAKRKKRKILATSTEYQCLTDRILQSPSSCALMKKIIEADLKSKLKAKRPDMDEIKGIRKILDVVYATEKIFEIDETINLKELLRDPSWDELLRNPSEGSLN